MRRARAERSWLSVGALVAMALAGSTGCATRRDPAVTPRDGMRWLIRDQVPTRDSRERFAASWGRYFATDRFSAGPAFGQTRDAMNRWARVREPFE